MDTSASRKNQNLPANSTAAPSTPEESAPRRRFKRFHQERCGYGRIGYDSYADVLEACERKLAQWEREGVLAPYRPVRPNDWLFSPSSQA